VIALVLLGAIGLFVLPALAPSWPWLFGLTMLALLPVLGFLLFATGAGDSVEEGYMLAFAVMGALPALGGAASRAASLWARGRGHGRPASLWIEGLGGLVTVGAVLAVTGGF
jgi:hypothetical protein